MLHNIYVKNLALIDEIEVELKKGLNILTGETGAGKSIILGSINLALGGRYSSDILRDEEEAGYVELTFYNDSELIDTYRNMAQWLRNTNAQNAMNKVIALKTGKSAALRIEVRKLNMTEPFEKTP